MAKRARDGTLASLSAPRGYVSFRFKDAYLVRIFVCSIDDFGKQSVVPSELDIVINLQKTQHPHYPPSTTIKRLIHVPCEGRDSSGDSVLPTCSQTTWVLFQFLDECKRLVGSCREGVINVAVHCKSGLNRTGFVTCSMLKSLYAMHGVDRPVGMLLEEFTKARGASMAKPAFVNGLFRTLSDVGSRPPLWPFNDPPPLGPMVSRLPWGGSEEHCGFCAELDYGARNKAASVIARLVFNSQMERRDIAAAFSKPVTLRDVSEIKDPDRYWVSWKADGMRLVLVFYLGMGFLIDTKSRVFVTHIRMRDPETDGGVHKFLALDGELVVTNRGTLKYLAYDVLFRARSGPYSTPSTLDLPFGERRQILKDAVGECVGQKLFGVEVKRFERSRSIRAFDDAFIRSLDHRCDGLILQPDSGYKCGTDPRLFKFKPPEEISVDFRLLNDGKLAVKDDGTREAVVGLLVGDAPPGARGKVVECVCADVHHGHWKFQRLRPDKDYPNHISVFRSNASAIKNNLTVFDLHRRFAAV